MRVRMCRLGLWVLFGALVVGGWGCETNTDGQALPSERYLHHMPTPQHPLSQETPSECKAKQVASEQLPLPHLDKPAAEGEECGENPYSLVLSKAGLAVANMRKDDGVLFSVDERGELTFASKLPGGEVVDLKSSKGCRYVAVFLSQPYKETFTVESEKASWIIRSPQPREPQTVLPIAPRE